MPQVFMKHFFSLLLALLCTFFMAMPADAAVHHITAEGSYTMGDNDSKSYARGKAVEEAKRAAIEQAGTYIEASSELKGYTITKDEVYAASAGILRMLSEEITFNTSGNAWVCKAKIEVEIDDSDVDFGKIIAYREKHDSAIERARHLDDEQLNLLASKIALERENLISEALKKEAQNAHDDNGRPRYFSFKRINEVRGLIIDARDFRNEIIAAGVPVSHMVIGEDQEVVACAAYSYDPARRDYRSNYIRSTQIITMIPDYLQKTVIKPKFINRGTPGTERYWAMVLDKAVAHALPPLQLDDIWILY